MIITLYSTILIIFLFNFYSFADASTSWQIGFQDPATPYIKGVLNFHNIIMFFIVMNVVIFIIWLFFKLYSKELYSNSENFTHSILLEVVWVIPTTIILTVGVFLWFIVLDSLGDNLDSSNEINFNRGGFLGTSYSYCDGLNKNFIKLDSKSFDFIKCSLSDKQFVDFLSSKGFNVEDEFFCVYSSMQDSHVFIFNLKPETVSYFYYVLTGITDINNTTKIQDSEMLCVATKKNFGDTLTSLRNDNINSNSLFITNKDSSAPVSFVVESCEGFPLFSLFDSNLNNSLSIIYNEFSDSYVFRLCLDQESANAAFFFSTGSEIINFNKTNNPQCLCIKADSSFLKNFLNNK